MSLPSDDVAVGALATPVGQVWVAVTRTGLARVSWVDDAEAANATGLPTVDDAGRLTPVLAQLGEYFAGRRDQFELPLDWRLTSGSRRTVLQTLHATVGHGTSVTYGELATRSGTGVPARGIGGIMGSNPIPIVVPCHRVLAHDGLGGYSGGSAGTGLEVKRWLLTLEGVLTPTLDWNPPG